MNRSAFLHIIFILIISSPVLFCQSNSEITFTEDDGLPGNQVMDVLKDRKGILWVATNNGVARYDGEVFSCVDDMAGKPLLMARALACANGDTVYAGSYKGGLAIIKGDSIRRIFHNRDRTSDRIRKLYYSDFYHLLVAGTENGLFILRDSIFIPVPVPVEKDYNAVVTSICGRDSLIYFTVADWGLFRLIPDRNGNVKPVAIRTPPQGTYSSVLSGDKIYTSRYNLLFFTDILVPPADAFMALIDSSFFIWSLASYKNGEILAGGIADERFKGRVVVYNPGQNSWRQLIHDGNTETVNSIFYDSIEDVVWIARENGLTAVFESPFEQTAAPGNLNILDAGFAGDSLFVLTSEGVFLKKDSDLVPFLSKEKIFGAVESNFARLKTRPYVFDNKGFKELVSLEKSGKLLFVSTQRGAISIPDLRNYLPFAAGTFYLTGEKSAYSQIKYVPFRFFPSYRDSIAWIEPSGPEGPARYIDEIIESQGILYCRSQINGLYVIRNNQVFRLSDANSIIDNYLTGLDRDPDGNVWCASGNGNLFEIGFSDSAFVKSKTELLSDGYSGTACRWIKFRGNYLFMGTNKGLSIIRRSRLFSKNPLPDYSFNEYNGYGLTSAHSPVTDRNGRIYVHTEKAIISIDTVFRSSAKRKLYIRNLNINGVNTPFSEVSDIDLTYGQKQVAFSFVAVKYPSGKNFRYRYKVGSDPWIEGNQVLLQSLRPGKYEINMEGFNTEDMSVINDNIAFTVKPPFWWSAWFIVLVIALSTLLFYFYLRFRIKRLNNEHEEKTKLVIQNSELQLRSLQIQMNPHFIFNSLNAIQAFIMEKNTEDSLKYLNDLSGIIRTNLENATEEYIFLSREIEFLKKYVQIEEMRFNNKLNVEFVENVSNKGIRLPPMLIQPVIENAIKHGVRNKEGPGLIRISFHHAGDLLSVMVEDNGAGREFARTIQNSSHQGLSLGIIEKRLDLLNRKYGTDRHNISYFDLKNEGVAAGTRVVINILAKN